MITSQQKCTKILPPYGMTALLPALVCPTFLDVTDIIDCAVNRHVIVVTGDVE